LKFLIITHVEHKLQRNQYFGYGPYVKEMNLWIKYVSELRIVAPRSSSSNIDPIDLAYHHPKIEFIPIPAFDLLSWKSKLRSILAIPKIFFVVLIQMQKSDHIHLRCPGNMGLVGCIAQIFFPSKSKTAKYAGNWDPHSSQPLSYRLQKWILSNQVLTRNMKVLVYGDWQPQNPNLKPFFTATYQKAEIESTAARSLDTPLKFIFVGSLVEGKNPIVSCHVVKILMKEGVSCELHLYGEGPERSNIERFIIENSLRSQIRLYGNVNASTLVKAYKESHFLLFASKSEGWPKAVAEAMFWGCLPITSRVSCVPEMVGNGDRGVLVNSDPVEIVNSIKNLQQNSGDYQAKAEAAMAWSRKYTLEKFQCEIKKLLYHE
jgi:Glycosyltransferase